MLFRSRYGNAYELPSPHAGELTQLFHKICEENGMLSDPEACFRFLRDLPEKYQQMSLFDMENDGAANEHTE